MSTTSQDILEAALQLGERDRALIAQQLLESLDPDRQDPIDDWPAELDRRLKEVRAGTAGLVSWSDLKQER